MESLSSGATPNLFQRRVKVEAIYGDLPGTIDLSLQNCQELARARGSLSPTLGCEGKIVCAVSISAITEHLNILRIDSHLPIGGIVSGLVPCSNLLFPHVAWSIWRTLNAIINPQIHPALKIAPWTPFSSINFPQLVD